MRVRTGVSPTAARLSWSRQNRVAFEGMQPLVTAFAFTKELDGVAGLSHTEGSPRFRMDRQDPTVGDVGCRTSEDCRFGKLRIGSCRNKGPFKQIVPFAYELLNHPL